MDIPMKSPSDSQSHKWIENTCESADQNTARPTVFT